LLRCSSLSTEVLPQNIHESGFGKLPRFLLVFCHHFSSSCVCRISWTQVSWGPEKMSIEDEHRIRT
jgi:hypothetical protein